MTLLDDYALYLRSGARRPLTIRKRLYYLNRLQASFPEILDVSGRDLVAWTASFDWAPETRRNVRQTLRGFYAWAVALGYLDASPAVILPAVKIPRRRVAVIPESVIDAALDRASDRDRLMLLLGSRAGLRRGEIAALAWADVTDLHLFVRDGKGGTSRVLPMPRELGRLLAAERASRRAGRVGEGWRYKVDPSSEFVFPAQRGGHMSADTVGGCIDRALGVASSHALRRRFATQAHKGTRDIRAVQELLGHASVTTTQLYVDVSEDDLRAAIDAAA